MPHPNISKPPEYSRGNQGLMGCDLIRVTEWLRTGRENDTFLKKVIKDMERDKIAWVIQRRQISRWLKPLKGQKVCARHKPISEYALFRLDLTKQPIPRKK